MMSGPKSALRLAVEHGDLPRLAHELTKPGVNVGEIDDNYDKPITLAWRYRLINTRRDDDTAFLMVEKLVEAGAEVDTANINGTTPLHLAATHNDLKSIQFLLTRAASPNEINRPHQNTPLHVAAMLGHKEAVHALLANRRTDPKCINANGETALHLYAGRCDIDGIRLMLERGADPTLVATNDGLTPAQRALENRLPESQAIADLIEQYVSTAPAQGDDAGAAGEQPQQYTPSNSGRRRLNATAITRDDVAPGGPESAFKPNV